MHVEGTYGENGIDFPSLKGLSSVFAWLSSLAKFMITSIQNSIISKRIKSRNDFILIFLKRKIYMLALIWVLIRLIMARSIRLTKSTLSIYFDIKSHSDQISDS